MISSMIFHIPLSQGLLGRCTGLIIVSSALIAVYRSVNLFKVKEIKNLLLNYDINNKLLVILSLTFPFLHGFCLRDKHIYRKMFKIV